MAFGHHVEFLKSNFLANGVQMIKTHEHVKFWQNRSIGCEDIKIFSIFQDGGRRHLGLSSLQNFIGWRCLEAPGASLYQISSKSIIPLQRYCDFLEFTNGSCCHLGLWNLQNFIHRRCLESLDASLYQTSSKLVVPLRRYCDFFVFSRWPPPPSWIFEIAKFYWLLGSRWWRRISIPNFVKISQSVAKILRFFSFSKWRVPPSWIFIFMKFHWQTVSGRPRLIIVLNVVKIGRFVIEILRFFEFSRWP